MFDCIRGPTLRRIIGVTEIPGSSAARIIYLARGVDLERVDRLRYIEKINLYLLEVNQSLTSGSTAININQIDRIKIK